MIDFVSDRLVVFELGVVFGFCCGLALAAAMVVDYARWRLK